MLQWFLELVQNNIAKCHKQLELKAFMEEKHLILEQYRIYNEKIDPSSAKIP